MLNEEVVVRLRDASCDRIAIEKAIKMVKTATAGLSEGDKELAWELMKRGVEDTPAMARLLLEYDIANKNT